MIVSAEENKLVVANVDQSEAGAVACSWGKRRDDAESPADIFPSVHRWGIFPGIDYPVFGVQSTVNHDDIVVGVVLHSCFQADVRSAVVAQPLPSRMHR